jgi:hypothetical protein
MEVSQEENGETAMATEELEFPLKVPRANGCMEKWRRSKQMAEGELGYGHAV